MAAMWRFLDTFDDVALAVSGIESRAQLAWRAQVARGGPIGSSTVNHDR